MLENKTKNNNKNSKKATTTRATTTHATKSLLHLICALHLLSGSIAMDTSEEVAAFTTPVIDWLNVKPMFLVSMSPGSSSSSSKAPKQSGKQQTTKENSAESDSLEANDDPIVLNLETIPLQDDMLPNDGRQAMNRIFGGNIGKPDGFPYQAGLLLQRPKGLYWCGGSLISDEYVLTAAHCVDMARRALVFLGAHEIKNAKEAGQVRIMVNATNFVIFPTWNPRRLKDDIALVRLPRRIEFTNRIQPIQLPKRSYEYRHFKNKLAIASGWGRYATGVHAISNVLRYVKLQIIDGRTCKRSFPLSYRSTNLCTSGRHARSTCNGDSGGPLVLQRRHSKKRVLVGLTSFGSIFGCDRGYPAAFTKVAAYLDWISDEAGVELSEETTQAVLFKDLLHDYEQKGDGERTKQMTRTSSMRNRKPKSKPKPKSRVKNGLIRTKKPQFPDAKLLKSGDNMRLEVFL